MTNNLKTALIRLEDRRRDAWFDKNREKLLDLLADDFHEINYFGRLNRDYIINKLFEELDLLEFDMSEFEVITSSDNTAILTYYCDEKIKFRGDEISGKYHVSAVYTKEGIYWKLLLWQITPFEDDEQIQ
ncbi:nuclear transport factor 2 family protein [Methanobacterium alcaliphilum]|uniref:nuclear transport factor 2 family protein n=1 Tax=Methanobacterium alcaliphilum TaxID=392018 RepID=UPI00200B6DE9|nr:nuclear transport factor 2 family protein [Methanobacterium alcaliphilum]MCK9150874.1 nuclear transport factor 2 family protein [Methanobacterium alcaliphilum]